MRKALAWAAGIGLVAAAWLVQSAAPGPEAGSAPYPVTAAIGEETAGRDVVVTVGEARRAAVLESGGWSGEGDWLVVDLDAASRLASTGALLGLAELTAADGTVFWASERPPGTLYRTPLIAGVPRSGSIAFELPADLWDDHSGPATLRLGVDGDPRFDSVIEVALDLGALPVREQVRIAPVGWSTP